MGVVLPYYYPARVVEEIGMLDHLTGGRLEIGTAIGVPQELARMGMTMAEARERNDEIVAVLDAALANRVVSHRGKYFSFADLRILPRRVAATIAAAVDDRRQRRIPHAVPPGAGSRSATGFNSTVAIKRIFYAYRDEAKCLPSIKLVPTASRCAGS